MIVTDIASQPPKKLSAGLTNASDTVPATAVEDITDAAVLSCLTGAAKKRVGLDALVRTACLSPDRVSWQDRR